jgi:S1-C subfamily serine protease
VKVELLRDRGTRDVDVTLDELRDERTPRSESAPAGAAPVGPGSKSPADLGARLVEMPGHGVVVDRVVPGGPADGQLEPGDIIVEVNRNSVTRAADVGRLVAQAPSGRPILLKIKRENVTRFVAIDRP